MEYLSLVLDFLVVLAVSFVALVLRGYFPSYLSEKGKNLATKEDVAQITRVVESVKIELWQGQQEFLWEKEDKKIKIDLYRDAVVFIKQLINFLDDVKIYESSRDAANFLSQCIVIDQSERDYYQGEYEVFRAKTESAYLEYRKAILNIEEVAVMVSIYFNETISLKLLSVVAKAKDNFSKGITPDEINQFLGDEIDKGHSLNAVKDSFNRLCSSRSLEFSLADEAAAFHEAIVDNVRR